MSESQGKNPYEDPTRAELEDETKQHCKNSHLLYSTQHHLQVKDSRIKYLENLVKEIKERAYRCKEEKRELQDIVVVLESHLRRMGALSPCRRFN